MVLTQSVFTWQVIQIFFPFADQLYPDQFPGTDPNDCPRDISREKWVPTCLLYYTICPLYMYVQLVLNKDLFVKCFFKGINVTVLFNKKVVEQDG